MTIILSPLSSLFSNVIAADESPKYIHLSWQHDPKTTMTISWRTNIETESIVQYGVDDSSTFEQVGTSGKWHAVELTSLHPDTKYLTISNTIKIFCIRMKTCKFNWIQNIFIVLEMVRFGALKIISKLGQKGTIQHLLLGGIRDTIVLKDDLL